jgi:hypothetical protein
MLLFAAQDEVVTFKIDCFATKGALHSESEQIMRMTIFLVLLTKQKTPKKLDLELTHKNNI